MVLYFKLVKELATGYQDVYANYEEHEKTFKEEMKILVIGVGVFSESRLSK